MSDNHDGHDHAADSHAPIGGDDPASASWHRRAAALQSILVEKGVFTAVDVQAAIEDMESRTPALGARLVARAWVDPEFRARLIENGKATAADFLGRDLGLPELAVLENTDRVHHLVVCTLCSCYPRPVLGLPPAWYKSLAYRSRAISDPRGVLHEFGLDLPRDVEIRVVDSTADMRYLVIPLRPADTDDMTEEQLAELVTRDSMIGVGLARQPVRA
jgi:nitrile hydratase subunit alpha